MKRLRAPFTALFIISIKGSADSPKLMTSQNSGWSLSATGLESSYLLYGHLVVLDSLLRLSRMAQAGPAVSDLRSQEGSATVSVWMGLGQGKAEAGNGKTALHVSCLGDSGGLP